MRAEKGKITLGLSFPFAALLTVMLLLCEERVVLLCLTSSLFHESGHLFFMWLFGDAPERVDFGVFGIRIERQQGRLSYEKEAIIALGGIIFNLLLCAFSSVLYFFGFGFALELFTVNALVAGLNSFPCGVLDMGRALECFFLSRFTSERAYFLMRRISLTSTGLFSLLFIIYTLFFGLNFSLLAVTIYLLTVTIIMKWS